MIRICCISDLHGYLPVVLECDLLLLGGDYCTGGDAYTRGQNHAAFCHWVDQAAEHCKVVGIAGNHDVDFERVGYGGLRQCNWTYLEDSETTWKGLKIWGSPYTPTFFDWAFNLDEHVLSNKWAAIPDDADIVITHGPPYGILDVSPYRNEHAGSSSLRQRVLTVKPKLHVFGHIHARYGMNLIGETLFVNASLVNEQYKPVNPPQVIELDVRCDLGR